MNNKKSCKHVWKIKHLFDYSDYKRYCTVGVYARRYSKCNKTEKRKFDKNIDFATGIWFDFIVRKHKNKT